MTIGWSVMFCWAATGPQLWTPAISNCLSLSCLEVSSFPRKMENFIAIPSYFPPCFLNSQPRGQDFGFLRGIVRRGFLLQQSRDKNRVPIHGRKAQGRPATLVVPTVCTRCEPWVFMGKSHGRKENSEHLALAQLPKFPNDHRLHSNSSLSQQGDPGGL